MTPNPEEEFRNVFEEEIMSNHPLLLSFFLFLSIFSFSISPCVWPSSFLLECNNQRVICSSTGQRPPLGTAVAARALGCFFIAVASVVSHIFFKMNFVEEMAGRVGLALITAWSDSIGPIPSLEKLSE